MRQYVGQFLTKGEPVPDKQTLDEFKAELKAYVRARDNMQDGAHALGEFEYKPKPFSSMIKKGLKAMRSSELPVHTFSW